MYDVNFVSGIAYIIYLFVKKLWTRQLITSLQQSMKIQDYTKYNPSLSLLFISFDEKMIHNISRKLKTVKTIKHLVLQYNSYYFFSKIGKISSYHFLNAMIKLTL